MPDHGLVEVLPSKRIVDFKFQNKQDVCDVVSAAANVCGAQFATISVLHSQHQYNFYSHGFDIDSIAKDQSICYHLQQGNEVLIIENLENTADFDPLPLGVYLSKVRFYAGIPLRNNRHELIGYLCVYHDQPLKITNVQRSLLLNLSQQLMQLFESGKIISNLETKMIDSDYHHIRREAIFDNTGMVTLLLDQNFSVMECHPKLAQLIYENLQREIKIGDDIRTYVGESTKSDFLKNFNLALKGQSVSAETRFGICWGGSNSFCHFSPAYNNDGQLIGVSYHALPISKEFFEDQVKNHSDQQMQWVNDLQSHRFRGPLSSILGITQIWKELGITPSTEEVDMIVAAANKLDREIQRVVFDLSKYNVDAHSY